MTLVLDLGFDPRWRRLADPGFRCPACGQRHGGLPELNIEKPFEWRGGERQDASSPDIDPRNYLLEDFCVIDNRQFFIRAVAALPLLGGAGATLAFSLFVALSGADFDRYGETFDQTDQSGIGTLPGRIANRIGGFPETLDLACAVRPRTDGSRPLVFVDAPEHPLAKAQHDGITLDQALAILAAMGHDMRPGLTVVN